MAKFWCLVLIINCISIIFSSGDILAAELPRVTVDSGDTPLIIKGTLDKKTTSFSGNVRLTVIGGEIKNLQILASDLSNINDTSVVIDRSKIMIPAGTSLSESQPRDVTVTVNSITHPGKYKGKIKFLFSGIAGTEPLEIPLELNIDAEPNVVFINDNLNIQLVRCQIDCGLATWLLPDTVVKDKWTIQLDNQTLTPVKVTDAIVVMQGEKTNSFLNKDQIYFSYTSQTLASQKVESIPLIIQRNQLSPDRYHGTLRFKIENADELVKLNTTIFVRDSPVWALIVIIAGILIGRLAQDMESSKAQKQINLMPRYYELDNLAKNNTTIKNEIALEFLHQKFDAIKQKINKGEETDEVIKQELDQLEVSIRFLDNLEFLEIQLSKLGLDALKYTLESKIQKARESLIGDNFEQAKKICIEIEEALIQAQADGSMGIADDIFESLSDKFRKSSNELIVNFSSLLRPKIPGGYYWNWLAKILATLSGIKTVEADVRYWLIRPFLWLVLLIILVLLGLQTFYVNAGATFGVNGFYDYLNLFLWGLSADIINQGLRKLQSGDTKKEGESN